MPCKRVGGWPVDTDPGPSGFHDEKEKSGNRQGRFPDFSGSLNFLFAAAKGESSPNRPAIRAAGEIGQFTRLDVVSPVELEPFCGGQRVQFVDYGLQAGMVDTADKPIQIQALYEVLARWVGRTADGAVRAA